MSGNVYAWTKLTESYNGKNQLIEHYYDKNTVENDGNYLKIWTETIVREKKRWK